MIDPWVIFLIGVNSLTTVILALYGIANFYLLLKSRRWQDPVQFNSKNPNNYPLVTIQLPLYNEPLVAERVILSALSLNYPQDRLQIQILDDSTDETTGIVQTLVSKYQVLGFDILLIHRKNRNGYKAGALAKGLKSAKGEFIAIFDADSIIPHDFLSLTLPYFTNSYSIGAVQTRWKHLNRYSSIITQALGMNLDVHFLLEQPGREKADAFLSFNGTGGIWRKTCIESAGGWNFDTLTEDLDLSYRAQFLGWEIIYLENIGTYQEIPSNISNMLSQQVRWSTGTAQCCRKHILTLLKHPDLSLKTKILGCFHLTNPFTNVLLLLNLLSFTCILLSDIYITEGLFFTIFYLIVSSFGSLWLINAIVIIKQEKLSLGKTLPILFFNIFLSFGLSFKLSLAFFKGLIIKGGNFKRTEKYAIRDREKKIYYNEVFRVKDIYKVVPEIIIGSFFIYCTWKILSHNVIESLVQTIYPLVFALAMFWLAFSYWNQLVFIPVYKKYLSKFDIIQ